MNVTALQLVILALAAYRLAALLVFDEFPFGVVREYVWTRWPPPRGEVPGSAFGYLWTCPSCMSVWTTAALFVPWLFWPEGTTVVAAPIAVAGGARALFGHRV